MKNTLKSHALFFELLLKAIDIGILLLCSWLAYYWYDQIEGISQVYRAYIQAILIAALLSVFVFQSLGLYKPWRGISLTREIPAVISSWSILFLLLAFIAVISKTSEDYSRGWFLLWYLCSVSVAVIFRLLLRLTLAILRKQGFNLRHIVIVSHNDFGLEVLQRLQNDKTHGLNVVALFSDNEHLHRQLDGQLSFGKLEQLSDFVTRREIDQVWIAMPLSEEKQVQKVIDYLRHNTVDIRYLPDISGFNLLNHSFTEISGFPVLDLSSSPMQGMNLVLKRIEDISLSIIILTLVSPLFLLIAVLIKLDSRGPIFYLQERVGWNNQVFKIIKFRTLPVDAEQKSGPVWAKKGEHRATRIGQFLRKTSLDELPQFFNVLQGNMSIVGPRPERPHFVAQFKEQIPGYMKKHMVKAGITGWAQVNGWRGNTDLNKRLEYDLYYIENWSLWFDFKIIFLTLLRGFVHPNAY